MDFFPVGEGFRSGVLRETNLIKGQRLMPGLEGLCRTETKGEVVGGETASTKREKGHTRRHGGRKEVARAGMPCSARPNAPLESPGLGERKQSGGRARDVNHCSLSLYSPPKTFSESSKG